MTEFITNKNACMLAFDKVIGKDTIFEGNVLEKSKNETEQIINFLVQRDCCTTIINF